LNKRRIRGKDKYLVRWKGFTAESDTWEGRENLGNIVMLQVNFPWKITFDTCYTNGFTIRIHSRTLSIFSENNTI